MVRSSLLLLGCLWTLVRSCPPTAPVGVFYRCQVTLFSNDTPGEELNCTYTQKCINYSASLIPVVAYQVREGGRAGRPDWLEHAPVPGGVVLYGTPSAQHLQAQLLVNVSQ